MIEHLRKINRKYLRINFRKILSPLYNPPAPFSDRYQLYDNRQITLYTSSSNLVPNYTPRKPIELDRVKHRVKVSLIATVKNEVAGAGKWVEAILEGRRLPDEIIVVDAGSDDGTIELLKSLAAKCPLSFRVVVQAGVNIAEGRNIAIRNAKHSIIAATDFGGNPQPGWLEKIVYPFEHDPATQVVAGWYEAVDSQGNSVNRQKWPSINLVNPRSFLPSSRSLAFKKTAWEAVGGYPEWLTMSGEDTFFAMELKNAADQWAFVPEAVINWHAPEDMISYWKKWFYWSSGNGEAGTYTKYYWIQILKLVMAIAVISTAILLFVLYAITGSWFLLVLALCTIGFASIYAGFLAHKQKLSIRNLFVEAGATIYQLLGFLKGAQNRKLVDFRRQERLNGLFFILSGVPIDDTGGGARCTQIALEMLRRQYMVVFINKYPKFESEELGIRISHPNLVTSPIDKFDLDYFVENNHPSIWTKPRGVLIEFPLDDFLPLQKALKTRGCIVIYDLLDDWNTSLGSAWYSLETEQEIITMSDHLVATAPVLKTRLEDMSGRPVQLLPNAVNLHIFNPSAHYPLPEDFPSGERSIIYTGALWGDWFDWDLLIDICQRHADLNVVMIGDYRGQSPSQPTNLHFLGLKPQWTLPAYLAHADVAFIPWKINEITKATSPLKIYEYLAMGKPVVAPDLPPLTDIPYVLPSKTGLEFIDNIQEAFVLQIDPAEINNFVGQNSWNARVDQLISLIELAKSSDRSPKNPPGE